MKLPNYLKVQLAVDTNIYAANELLGPKFEIDLSAYQDVDELILEHVMVIDRADQSSVNYLLVLFDEDPTNTTFTDNSALDINDADMDKIIAAIPVTVTADLGGAKLHTQSATNTMRIPIPIKNAGTQKIYGALMITAGTPTYAANSVSVKLGFETLHRAK